MISSLLLILYALLAFPTLAAKPAVNKERPVLEVTVKLLHSTQWTKVYTGKDGWYCATENNPMFPLPKKPAVLTRFKGKVETGNSCLETFVAVLTEAKERKIWSGCIDDGEAASFFNSLGKECGRF